MAKNIKSGMPETTGRRFRDLTAKVDQSVTIVDGDGAYVLKAGDNMTGQLGWTGATTGIVLQLVTNQTLDINGVLDAGGTSSVILPASSNITMNGVSFETELINILLDDFLPARYSATWNTTFASLNFTWNNASGGIAGRYNASLNRWTFGASTGGPSYVTIKPTGAGALEIQPFGVSAGNTGQVRWKELVANGQHYTGFKAPDSLAANVVYTLPTSDGTAFQALSTNGAGVLSWASTGMGACGEPITNGDIANPEILFAVGDVVMSGVCT